MKALLIRFFFCLAICLLSSCTINTSARIADCGRVYECVRLDGAAWRCGNSIYVRGKRGQYHRHPEFVQWAVAPGMSGAFIRVSETEEQVSRIYEVLGNGGIDFFIMYSGEKSSAQTG